MHNIQRLFRFILIATGLNLLVFFILRFGLFWYFNQPIDPIPANEIMKAFYLGLKFDLRLSLMMTLPLFLLGGIRMLSPFEYDFSRRTWLFIQGTIFTVVLFVYFINFAHFSYLHKPLDASALRFLQNFSISMEMAWETYPIVSLVLLFFTVKQDWYAFCKTSTSQWKWHGKPTRLFRSFYYCFPLPPLMFMC